MFQTIVVGADSSPTARHALQAAADLAQMANGTLHIVTSLDPEQGPMRSEHGGYVDPDSPADVLLEILSAVAKERGLEPVLHPSSATPADALVGVAEEVAADLIVVGNKGMKGVRRVLGSVPNSVAHGAPCSVLIVDTVGAD